MLSIRDLTAILWRRKKVAGLVFAVVNALILSVLLIATPIYESTAWVLIDAGRALQPEPARDAATLSKQDQVIKTQATIVQSDAVVRRAIGSFGASRLFPSLSPGTTLASADETRAVNAARNALYVNPEANTDLLRVSFRHTDSAVAAQFTNELVKTYLERHAALYGNPEAATFFREEQARYEAELGRAQAALKQFEAKTATFSVEEQQRLYLSRRDQVNAALASTQGLIKQSEGQLASIKFQLSVLKSRITLPPEIFGTTGFGKETPATKSNDALWTDPPLLHVKLYQETAQRLVNVNIEFAGLKALEERQQRELTAVDNQLQALSAREGEFARLKQAVNNASTYLNTFGKKLAEARTDNAWRSNEGLSSVQIMQPAVESFQVVFPKASLLIPFGLSLGLLAAGVTICIAEMWSSAGASGAPAQEGNARRGSLSLDGSHATAWSDWSQNSQHKRGRGLHEYPAAAE